MVCLARTPWRRRSSRDRLLLLALDGRTLATLEKPRFNVSQPTSAVRDPEGHVWSFGSYDPFAPIEDA